MYDNEYPDVVTILKELSKPHNRDLMMLVATSEGSLEFEFSHVEPIDLEKFCRIQPQLDQFTGNTDSRPMSERYADYLTELAASNAALPMRKSESDRYNAILDQVDGGSWSGAVAEFIMQRVKFLLRQMVEG